VNERTRSEASAAGPSLRTASAELSTRGPASVRAILAHERCEQFSEVLIYSGLILSPWAFGTPAFWSDFNTEQFWSTRLLNFIGYALGVLLGFKWFVRWRYHYRPLRWTSEMIRGETARGAIRLGRGLTSFTACVGGTR
jgi:hypothetical protein